jgi:diketogulonate reductase-like aldo/keto reductase
MCCVVLLCCVGRVASIGVSNFDSHLLGEFWGFGGVRPHLIQNFAEPGKIDSSVRQWCSENDAVYMPYAHQRNLRFLSSTMKEHIETAAEKYAVSPHVIISRFFLQTGCFLIVFVMMMLCTTLYSLIHYSRCFIYLLTMMCCFFLYLLCCMCIIYIAGAAIVPRSSQSAHLKENLEDVSKFELTAGEMSVLGWTLPDAVHEGRHRDMDTPPTGDEL